MSTRSRRAGAARCRRCLHSPRQPPPCRRLKPSRQRGRPAGEMQPVAAEPGERGPEQGRDATTGCDSASDSAAARAVALRTAEDPFVGVVQMDEPPRPPCRRGPRSNRRSRKPRSPSPRVPAARRGRRQAPRARRRRSRRRPTLPPRLRLRKRRPRRPRPPSDPGHEPGRRRSDAAWTGSHAARLLFDRPPTWSLASYSARWWCPVPMES